MESLSFSKNEMAAIIKLALLMASADGYADEKEGKMIKTEMLRFGMTTNEMQNLCIVANDMTPQDAMKCVASMSPAQKRYVTAYLGTLMVIDGDKDDAEMALWKFVSSACNLPTMTIADVVHYMAN